MNIRLTEYEKQEIIRMYNEKIPSITIGKILNRYESTIRNYLKSQGLKAIPQTILQRRYKLNDEFFDTIDTEEKAYFLGILFADGYNREDRNTVVLALKESDKELLLKLSLLLETDRPLYYIDMKKYNSGFENSTNQYRLTINNKRISKALAKLGCTNNKTNSLIFPSFLPNDLKRHFIRGYFDGDGSISKGKTPRIDVLANEEFLIDLQLYLNKEIGLNITNRAKRHKERDSNVKRIQISGRNNCLKFCKLIYEDSTIYMERKFKIYNEYYLNK